VPTRRGDRIIAAIAIAVMFIGAVVLARSNLPGYFFAGFLVALWAVLMLVYRRR
jgi:hypothetical protein